MGSSKFDCRGFTLVELMVVIGIIIILAGLLAVLIPAAKRASLVAVDTEGLRQLSAAASLYQADNNDLHPGSVLPLLRTGLVNPERVASKADNSSMGWLNEWVNEQAKLNPPYIRRMPAARVSYLGVADLFGIRNLEKIRNSGENSGWLISFAPAPPRNFGGGKRDVGSGSTLRLTFDHSVVKRAPIQREGSIAFVEWFADRMISLE